MGGSRIFDWRGPRIVKVREYGKNVALFTLKSWPIGGGGHGPEAPPPGTALDLKRYFGFALSLTKLNILQTCPSKSGRGGGSLISCFVGLSISWVNV